MRKSKEVRQKKMVLRDSYKEMLVNPYIRFKMAVTNRAIGLIKEGKTGFKVRSIIRLEQEILARKIHEDLKDLELTPKSYEDLLFTEDDLHTILNDANSIIEEMEWKR